MLEDTVKSSVWYSSHSNPPAVLSEEEMRMTYSETEEYIDQRVEAVIKSCPIIYQLCFLGYLP